MALFLFVKAALEDRSIDVFNNGEMLRDFTYIDNVVSANLSASEAKETHGEVINIACGKRITINQLSDIIKKELKSQINPIYGNERPGDVKHSLADITLANKLINYKPIVDVYEGLQRTIEYFKEKWGKAE